LHKKLLFRLLSFSPGIALLMAALFFETGTAVSGAQQATTTPDRLAQPTLPASPSQADHGSQVYWLSCLPCHGDRGQGLTDEFRQAYPPEEQYCWESGCHGERPYDQGFTLPTQIPPVVGPGTLQKFPNASVLHAYIAAAMPFWKPGSLAEEDSWSVTAYLLQQNGLWDGTTELGESNATAVNVGPQPAPTQSSTSSPRVAPVWLFIIIAVMLVLMLAVLLVRSRRSRPE
jgi:cytochrome c